LDNHDERLGKGVLFERIRRITGYLVGSLEKWNDAKKAEERDRVRHGVGCCDVTVTGRMMNDEEEM